MSFKDMPWDHWLKKEMARQTEERLRTIAVATAPRNWDAPPVPEGYPLLSLIRAHLEHLPIPERVNSERLYRFYTAGRFSSDRARWLLADGGAPGKLHLYDRHAESIDGVLRAILNLSHTQERNAR